MLAKYKQGLRGWDDKMQRDTVTKKLIDNLERKDWTDVANLSMMMYFFDLAEEEIRLNITTTTECDPEEAKRLLDEMNKEDNNENKQ